MRCASIGGTLLRINSNDVQRRVGEQYEKECGLIDGRSVGKRETQENLLDQPFVRWREVLLCR